MCRRQVLCTTTSSCTMSTHSRNTQGRRQRKTMPSSVLVLRSSCLSGEEDGLGERERTTHQSVHDSNNSTDDGTTMTQLGRDAVYANTPLSCDIAIVPEIPLENESQRIHRRKRQSLNPCGMDNVLVLSDLPQSDSGAYLLTITSCKAAVTQYSAEEENRVDEIHDEQSITTVSVNAVPSTFAFRSSKTVTDADDDDDDDEETSTHRPMDRHVAPMTRSYSELSVAFDMEPMEHIIMGRLEKRNIDNNEDDDDTTEMDRHRDRHSFSTPTNTDQCRMNHHSKRYHRPFNRNDRDTAAAAADDELLVLTVLRDLAAKETRDLNRMLAGLSIIAILCFIVMLRVVWMRMMPTRRQKRDCKRAVDSRTKERGLLRSHCGIVGTSADERNTDGRANEEQEGATERPPVRTVSVDHENSDAITPLSLEPTSPPQPSRSCIVVADRESTTVTMPVLMKDLSTCMFDQQHDGINKEVRYLPSESEPSLLVESHNNTTQTAVSLTDKNIPDAHGVLTDKPRPLVTDINKLSPCSKLEQEWLRNKASRRDNRAAGPRTILVPKDSSSPCNGRFRKSASTKHRETGGTSKLFPSHAPTMVASTPYAFGQDVKSSIGSQSTPQARDPKLSPADTPATHRTCTSGSQVEGSFMNDYWGA